MISRIPLDSSENGLFSGRFVPPPPRPPTNLMNIEEIPTDGITTCDLCGWALNDNSFFSFEGAMGESADFGWVFLLLIVSFISALAGAVIMIFMLRYRRSDIMSTTTKQENSSAQLCISKMQQKQENFYETSSIGLTTFMKQTDEETFYASLDDHESIGSENNLTHQNNDFYAQNDENDAPLISSAPSSAYYSDLSNPIERPYETVESFNHLERDIVIENRHVNRLSAISENNPSAGHSSAPSQYV